MHLKSDRIHCQILFSSFLSVQPKSEEKTAHSQSAKTDSSYAKYCVCHERTIIPVAHILACLMAVLMGRAVKNNKKREEFHLTLLIYIFMRSSKQ